MEMLLINRYYYYYFYYYYYHYYYTFKNSGLSLSLPTIIFMCEHSSFKRVITPSNFATTISWLFRRSGQERSRDSISVQQSSWSVSNKHQSFVSHNFLFLENLKCRVPQ